MTAGPLEIESRVLLCEGLGDFKFLGELCRRRGLGRFEIDYPKNQDGPFGRQGLGRLLSGRSVKAPIRKAVAVLTDSDYDPMASFREVQDVLRRDCEGCRVPERPGVFVPQEDGSLVAVFLIPGTETHGSLDSLCLAAMREAWPSQARCLDEFTRCSGVKDWDPGKQDKSALRCLLAATCEEDPNTGLPYAWSRNAELVPLSNRCFDPVAEILARFDVLCAEAVPIR